jgi:hypothetical protein
MTRTGHTLGKTLAGAAAGLAATVPMTAAMMGLHRGLPADERYPLPPRRITMRAAKKAGIKHWLDEPQKRGVTLAAHFGYGTAAGIIFGLIAPRRAAEAIPAGIGFGLLVWSASYLGLLPALDLHPPATRDTVRRNALMIAAHVVWGASLGAVAAPLRRALDHR